MKTVPRNTLTDTQVSCLFFLSYIFFVSSLRDVPFGWKASGAKSVKNDSIILCKSMCTSGSLWYFVSDIVKRQTEKLYIVNLCVHSMVSLLKLYIPCHFVLLCCVFVNRRYLFVKRWHKILVICTFFRSCFKRCSTKMVACTWCSFNCT